MSASLKVRYMTPQDALRWDQFVERSPQGTVFHRAGWQAVFEDSLGHDTYYLLAERGGDIHGLLPLVHIRSRLFHDLLASLPFLAYGGVVASDEAAANALRLEAHALGAKLGVEFIEFRNRDEACDDWLTKSTYVTFRKAIPETPEECMKMIPRKQRAMVRKGIGHRLESRLENSLDNFYPIFAESYRNLGTPVLSRKYFEAIRATLGPDCGILTIFADDRAVASVMSFYFRGEVIPYYGGSVAVARDLKANDFMYWELMRRSCESGINLFDFGRSRLGTGSYRFKKHWGFEEAPLYYQYDLLGNATMPDLSPGNAKYRIAIGIWKRLPVGLTRVLGPALARGMPG